MIVKVGEFRNNLSTYLELSEKEPVYITRHGEVIGVVSAPHADEDREKASPSEIEICLHEIKGQIKQLNKILEKIPEKHI